MSAPSAKAHAEFSRAAEEYAARPNSADAILEMITTAMEDPNPVLRRWASRWLRVHCNILVTDEPEGQDDAAPPSAAGILR